VNSPHPPPAGWYPDPSGRAPFRYWDGSQWTEHTNQGTPPSPSIGQPAPPAPQAYAGTPAAPQSFGQQIAPGFPGAPAAPAAPGGPLTVQSFVEDLKRFDGFAIAVVCAALFVVFSFFSWADADATNTQTGQSASSPANAWSGEDGPWLIRGWDVTLENLQKFEAGQSVDSGTDMVVLLPLLLGAVGVAAAVRMGKPITRGPEIAVGLAALLSVLMIAELVHLNGASDDLKSIYSQYGVRFDGGPGFGLYISLLASLALTVALGRMYQASKQV